MAVQDPRFRKFSTGVQADETRGAPAAPMTAAPESPPGAPATDPRFMTFAPPPPPPPPERIVQARQAAEGPSPLEAYQRQLTTEAFRESQTRAQLAAPPSRDFDRLARGIEPVPIRPTVDPAAQERIARTAAATLPEGAEREPPLTIQAARQLLGHDDPQGRFPLGQAIRQAGSVSAVALRDLAASVPTGMGIMARWRPDPEPLPGFTRFSNIGRRMAGAPEREAPEASPEMRARREQYAQTMFNLADAIRGDAEPFISDDPRVAENYVVNTLIPGTANMLGFVTLAVAGAKTGLGPSLAVGLAATSGQARAYQEALDRGLSEEEALDDGILGTLPGVIQVTTPLVILNRLNRMTGGTALQQLAQLGRQAGISAVNEAIVNTAGEVGFNLIAERPAFENAGAAMRDGGAVAFFTTALLGVPSVGFNRAQQARYLQKAQDTMEAMNTALEVGIDPVSGQAMTEAQRAEIISSQELLQQAINYHVEQLGRPAPEVVAPLPGRPGVTAEAPAPEVEAEPGRPEDAEPALATEEIVDDLLSDLFGLDWVDAEGAIPETLEGLYVNAAFNVQETELLDILRDHVARNSNLLSQTEREDVQKALADAQARLDGTEALDPAPEPMVAPETVQAPTPGAEPVAESAVGDVPFRTNPDGSTATHVHRYGRESVVIMPTGEEIPVRYSLVDASQAPTSHNPMTFQINPDFPEGIQDRRYHSDRAAQYLVESRTRNYNIRLGLDMTVRATDGMPISRQDGVTLSGNQRRMMLIRLQNLYPDVYRQYLAQMIEDAPAFGMTPEQMGQDIYFIQARGGIPMIDRVIEGPQPTSRTELRRLMAMFNETGTKARDPLAEGAVLAARLLEAPNSLRFFEQTISPEQTVRDYLSSASGRDFVISLVNDGVLTEEKMAALVREDGSLTPDGRNQVEAMLLSAAVGSADVIENAPDGWLVKIEKAVPAIIETGTIPGWSLQGILRDVLEAAATVQATPELRTIIDVTGQEDILGPRYSPETDAVARFIEANTPLEVTAAIRRYGSLAREARNQMETEDLFGTPPITPTQAVRDVFDPTGQVEGLRVSSSPFAQSASGTLSLESIPLDAGGLVMTSEMAAPPGAQPVGPQVSTPADPSSLATSRETPPSIDVGPIRTLGTVHPFVNKMVLQARDDLAANLERAQQVRPVLLNILQSLAESTPGVQVFGVRVKEIPRLQEKVRLGRPPSVISDYLGGRVWVDELAQIDMVMDRLEQAGFGIIEDDVFIVIPKGGYRARHVQVVAPEGDFTFELQIVPREVGEFQAELRTHQLFEITQLRESFNPSVQEVIDAYREMTSGFDQAWARFQERTGMLPTAGVTPRPVAFTQAPAAEPTPAEAPRPPPAQQPVLTGTAGLEVQDDIFGGPPVFRGEEQRDMFGPEPTMQSISQAENQARATVSRIQPRFAAGVATNSDLEAYREALSVMRRNELISNEEMTIRARELAREAKRVEEPLQQSMFMLAPTTPPIAPTTDLNTVQVYDTSLESFAGEPPVLFAGQDPQASRDWMQWHAQAKQWQDFLEQALGAGHLDLAQYDDLATYTQRIAQPDGRITTEQQSLPRPEVAPVPEGRLFHVTSAWSSVRDLGVLTNKELRELGDFNLTGMGGGADQMVPVATSAQEAEGMYDGVLTTVSVLRGNLPLRVLVADAIAGQGADQSWAVPLANMYQPGSTTLADTQSAATFLNQVAQDLDAQGASSEPAVLARRMEFMRNWLFWREARGGMTDPRFHWSVDPVSLRNTNLTQLAILEVEPQGTVHGRQNPERPGRWSIPSGRGLHITAVSGQDPLQVREGAGILDEGWAESLVKRELEKDLLRGEAPMAVETQRIRPRPRDVLPDVREFSMEMEAPGVRPPALSEIRADMEKVLGIPIRTGRLKALARAFGLYQIRPEVIRTRMANDIDVIAHEVGHHMHKLLFTRAAPTFDPRNPALGLNQQDLTPWADELEPLGAGISGGGLAEGWAEYWRRWLTNREAVEARAPKLTAWLRQELPNRDPALWDAVQRWQGMYSQFAQATPMARVMSRVAFAESRWDKIWNGARRGFDRAYTEVLDKYADLETMQRDILQASGRKRLDTLAEKMEDIPKIMADMIAGAGGMADHFISRAPVSFRTGAPRTDVKSLKGILAPIRDQLEWFETYTIARRALNLQTERGLDQGFETADLQATVNWVEQNHPEWVQAADELMAYQESLLDYIVDAGVLTREAADAFREGNPFYVPLFKVQDDARTRALGGNRKDHVFSPIKRIGSSSRDIISPIESIIKNTYFYTQLAQKQRVSQSLAAMSELQGAGKWIRPIEEPTVVAAKVGKQELTDWMRKEIAKELGYEALGREFMDQIEELLPQIYMVMRPGDYLGKENVISILETVKDERTGRLKSQRRWFEVNEDIYRALTHTPEAMRIGLFRMLSFPAQTLRVGATTAPEFILRNPFRDQFVAFVQSEYGYTPGVDLARGIFHMLGRTDAYWSWKRSGGEFATIVDMDRRGVLEGMRKIQEAPLTNVIKFPWQALQAMAATTENATRIAEFINVVRAGGEKKGFYKRWLDEIDPEFRAAARQRMEALGSSIDTQAAWHSREISTQYSTHGASNTMQVFRILTTFFNARIQSYNRLYRAFKEDPVGASLRAGVSITIPTMMLYLMNREDEEYWEIPQWQRDWFYLIKVPNPFAKGLSEEQVQRRDQEYKNQPFVNTGETTWLRFPIPWELGFVYKTIPERILEWMDADDPQGLERSLNQMLGSQIYGTLIPAPTFAMPVIENIANYSFFMQREIDPTWEEAEGRFIQRPGISPISVGMADMADRMGLLKIPGAEKVIGTPSKIENLMYGYTGGVGRLVLDIAEASGRQVGLFDQVQRRPLQMADVPLVRGFTGRDPAYGSSESEQRFRREYRQVREVTSTIRLLEREERWDKLEEYLQDPRVQEMSMMEPYYRSVSNQLSQLWALANQVQRSEELTPQQKLEQLRELGTTRQTIAREAIQRRLPSGQEPE